MIGQPLGECPDCGSVGVNVEDDGAILWVICGVCDQTVYGWSRDEAPGLLRLVAEVVDE